MAQPIENKIPLKAFKQVAELWGIILTDKRLEALTPRIQQTVADLARLDELELGDTEPAPIFQMKKQ
ncbi:MAG: hypothetical protein HY666_06795 [Chloroflexi bacterium]|nr:hypothetical protein [Chloroflexota bacterium]